MTNTTKPDPLESDEFGKLLSDVMCAYKNASFLPSTKLDLCITMLNAFIRQHFVPRELREISLTPVSFSLTEEYKPREYLTREQIEERYPSNNPNTIAITLSLTKEQYQAWLEGCDYADHYVEKKIIAAGQLKWPAPGEGGE